jgi:hypothetical protein
MNKRQYMCDLNLGQFSGAVTAGSIFTFRTDPDADKIVLIKKIFVSMGFTGTGEATSQIYQLKMFSAATPSGGAAITPSKRLSTSPASSVLDIRSATISGTSPLTVTSVSFDVSMRSFSCARRTGVNPDLLMEPYNESKKDESGCILLPGEGFAILTVNTAVVGDIITGCLTWEEHDRLAD